MKEMIKKHAGAILGIVLMSAMLSILAIGGGAIMKLFGFQYESVGSIIKFFLIVNVLGFPIEMLAKGLPNVLLSLNKINLNSARILFLVLDTITTMVAMTIVDYFMESVSATSISMLVIAIIMAFFCVADIKERPVNE